MECKTWQKQPESLNLLQLNPVIQPFDDNMSQSDPDPGEPGSLETGSSRTWFCRNWIQQNLVLLTPCRGSHPQLSLSSTLLYLVETLFSQMSSLKVKVRFTDLLFITLKLHMVLLFHIKLTPVSEECEGQQGDH